MPRERVYSNLQGRMGRGVLADYEKDASNLAMMCCYSDKHSRKEIEELAEQFTQKWEEAITQEVAVLNGMNGVRIIEALSSLKGLLPKAELLIAMHETAGMRGSLDALTNSGFISGLNRLDDFVAGSLLYEAGISAKIDGALKSLTDPRLFTDHSIRFLNRLDIESSSGWFSSIAKTGNVGLLTSEKVMSQSMQEFISAAGDLAGKMAADLSFLIGDIGATDTLADPTFLRELSGMRPAAAAQYIDGFFINDGNAAIPGLNNPNAQRVLMVNPGETHNRNALLIARDLAREGYAVIWAGGNVDYREIARIAAANNVQAIGIGMSTDIQTGAVKNGGFVHGIMREMKINGMDGVVTFVGGRIDQKSAAGFEQQGIKVMGMGSLAIGTSSNYGYRVTSAEVISFLNTAIGGVTRASISYGKALPLQTVMVVNCSSATQTAGFEAVGFRSAFPAGADPGYASRVMLAYKRIGASTSAPIVAIATSTRQYADAVPITISVNATHSDPANAIATPSLQGVAFSTDLLEVDAHGINPLQAAIAQSSVIPAYTSVSTRVPGHGRLETQAVQVVGHRAVRSSQIAFEVPVIVRKSRNIEPHTMAAEGDKIAVRMRMLVEENAMLKAEIASLKARYPEISPALPGMTIGNKHGLKVFLRDAIGPNASSDITRTKLRQENDYAGLTALDPDVRHEAAGNGATTVAIEGQFTTQTMLQTARPSLIPIQWSGIKPDLGGAVGENIVRLDGKRVKMLPALLKDSPAFFCHCSCHDRGR